MGKKSSKNVHKKKSSSEKHKKRKKNKLRKHKKYKKNRYSSESSESSTTSISSSSSELDNKKQLQVEKSIAAKYSDDECQWHDLFSERNTISRIKNKNKSQENSEYTVRELNPNWKNGGNGLPPVNNVKQPVEMLKKETENVKREKPHELNYVEMKSTKKTNFIKPDEVCNINFFKTNQRNWKKKEFNSDEAPATPKVSNAEEDKQDDVCKTKPVLTPDELNALVARAIKAEIMGDKILAEKLKKEVEIAKKDRNESSSTTKEIESEKNKEETIILINTNIKGVTRPVDDKSYSNYCGRKKRPKTETHRGNKKLKYFMDNDKQSLKSMFEKEKAGVSNYIDEALYRVGKEHNKDEIDEAFVDQIRSHEFVRKESEAKRKRDMNEAKAKHKSLNECRWCLDGNNMQKHLVIFIGAKCYLCLPDYESLTDGHCLIVPISHDSCGVLLDEDVWEEMQWFRQILCKMFEDDEKEIIFFETASSFHRFSHMVLHCVPMDKKISDLAPIYFKKAILESESEWSSNKKLIELAEKGLRRSIPKGLNYFSVHFGREEGFAHIIEDEKSFPHNFAEEVIAGMLDLEPAKWRKRKKESFDVQKEKVLEFSKKWKKYELNFTK